MGLGIARPISAWVLVNQLFAAKFNCWPLATTPVEAPLILRKVANKRVPNWRASGVLKAASSIKWAISSALKAAGLAPLLASAQPETQSVESGFFLWDCTAIKAWRP